MEKGLIGKIEEIIMHEFDTYTLYEIKKRNVYSVRINVILGDPVQGDILKTAAEKAFRRFPY